MALTPPPAAPPAAPTAPGDAPSRANPSTFRDLADAFVVWLVGFRNSIASLVSWLQGYTAWAGTHVTEMNALQTDVQAKSSTASTAAASASADADAAAASRLAIDNRIYPGSFTSDPATRPGGGAPQPGDIYFNSTVPTYKAFFGGVWSAVNLNAALLAAPAGASLVGFLAAISGAVPRDMQGKGRERISLADVGILPGAPAAGVAEKLNAVMAAVAALGGGIVEADAGTYTVDGTIFGQHRVYIHGKGQFATTFKLANGMNAPLFETAGYSDNVGTASNLDLVFGLQDLSLDGNRANNATGDVLRVYARAFLLKNLGVLNAAENGCQFEYGAGSEALGGMEAYIENVVVDTCGKHCVAWRGPHDAHINKLVLIDGSQLADNTYDGFSMSGTTGGLRAVNVHPWKRSSTVNRMRFGALANGGRWSMCTFEGAYVAFKAAGAVAMDNTTLFGARTDATLVVESSDCAFINCQVWNNAGAAINAVRMGVSGGGSALKLTMLGCNFTSYAQPLLNIENGGGFANIEGRTFSCASPLFTGSLLLNSDRVTFKGDGSPSQNFRHAPTTFSDFGAGGSDSASALRLTTELCRITGTGTFRVDVFRPGRQVEVFNRSGSAVTVYPPEGTSFVNAAGSSIANDQAITLPATASFRITAINNSQGIVFMTQLAAANSIAAAPSYVGQIAVAGGLAYIATGTATTADWKQAT